MDNKAIARELGTAGGLKTSKLYGKEHYIKMQKLSVESRKSKAKLLVDKR